MGDGWFELPVVGESEGEQDVVEVNAELRVLVALRDEGLKGQQQGSRYSIGSIGSSILFAIILFVPFLLLEFCKGSQQLPDLA